MRARAPAQMLCMQSRFGFMQSQVMMRRTAMSVLPAVSMRSIHARGYNNQADHVSMIHTEINFALMYAKNTPNIVFIYEKFGEEFMTPEQIMFGFNYICQHGLEKNPEFWNIILPMVKKQLATLDRETTASLKTCISGAAHAYI